MLQAYACDPRALLEGDGWPPPSYANRHEYRDATLRVGMGPCPAGTRLHAVAVDWERGAVALYASPQDRLNRTPLFEAHEGGWPPCAPAQAEAYVRQTYAFLLRGHSLRAPGCECAANACRLGTQGAWPLLSELARELCVRDLGGRVEVLRRRRRVLRLPLLQVLTELAGLQLTPDGRRIGSPACCLPLAIASAADVLRAAELLAPRPYLYRSAALDPLTQSEVRRGLAQLQAALHVRVLASEEEGALAVFFNTPWLHLEATTGGMLLRDAWTRAGAVAPPPPPLPPPPAATRPALERRKRPSARMQAYARLLKRKV